MPDINITVAHKVAVSDTQSIVCDNSDYTVHWTLDEDWSAYDTKTMRTIYMDGTFEDKVFNGDTIALPVCTVPGVVQIGLFAGDIRTSRVAIMRALPSVRSAAGAPADPTPDVYDQLMELIKGLGGADPEAIKTAVAEYLAAHPIEETDPTVPAWAKAETKPTYSAAEVGAIAQSDLQVATNAALALAKSSGEFDGPAGPTGPQGPAGATGKDGADGKPGVAGAPGIYYGTTQPTGDTHPVWLDPGGDHDDGGLLPAVTAADNGKVLSVVGGTWSPVDMPSGGDGPAETFELIKHIKTTEAVNEIRINADDIGEPFELEEAQIYTHLYLQDDAAAYIRIRLHSSINGSTAHYDWPFIAASANLKSNTAVGYPAVYAGYFKPKDYTINNKKYWVADTWSVPTAGLASAAGAVNRLDFLYNGAYETHVMDAVRCVMISANNGAVQIGANSEIWIFGKRGKVT